LLENLATLVIKPAFGNAGLCDPLRRPVERCGRAASRPRSRPIPGNMRPGTGAPRHHPRLVRRLPAARSVRDAPVRLLARRRLSVMPGGLTRFDRTGADAIVSLQQGSATKDIWVIAASPTEDPPALTLAEPPRYTGREHPEPARR